MGGGFPALDFDVGHDAVIFVQADDFAVGHSLQELVVAVVGLFSGFQLLAVAVGVCLVLFVFRQGGGDLLLLELIVVGGVDAVGFQLVYMLVIHCYLVLLSMLKVEKIAYNMQGLFAFSFILQHLLTTN